MSFYIIASVVCILLSAFFSASEMAFSSANRIRLENLAEDGSKAAAMAVKVIDRFDDALSAILIGNNFVNIALSSLASLIAITAFSENYAWLATVIVTVTVIIFGETMPKIMAKRNANRVALGFAPIIRFLTILLTPITWVVVGLVHLITRPLKGEKAGDEQEAAVEELQSIIETAEDEEVLDEDRSELLQAALDFNEISASQVMTARVDIVAIDIEDDWEDILETVSQASYSRIPVYEGSIDNIIGTLYLNHFFKALIDAETVDIRAMLMEPCYIYKTTKLPAVLDQFKKSKRHMAIVTDEYGGCLGLITLEDVLEQIVGDIWDETDEIETEIVERAEGEYELSGDMDIGDFIELVGLSEETLDSDSSTVGGWTIERFGSFPQPGQSFTFRNLNVTVLAMDGLRVDRVLVKIEKECEDEDE
ncbi:MAG: hemolysin family protein [Oscillospiraceae bacterium]